MELAINALFDSLGLDVTKTLLVMVTVSLVSGLIGRLIPDDATGLRGLIRDAAKILGLYASNRITHGVTVNQAVEASIGIQPEAAEIEAGREAGVFNDASR